MTRALGQIIPRVRPYRRRVAPLSRVSTHLTMVLSKALRAATRGVSTSAGARMALPALTTAVPKPSMMSAIFGGSSGPAMPPMDQPVAGLSIPEPPAAPAAAPVTNITTLSNGAKIASEDTPVSSDSQLPMIDTQTHVRIGRTKPLAEARDGRASTRAFPRSRRPKTRVDTRVGHPRRRRRRRTRGRDSPARDHRPSLASPTRPPRWNSRPANSQNTKIKIIAD